MAAEPGGPRWPVAHPLFIVGGGGGGGLAHPLFSLLLLFFVFLLVTTEVGHVGGTPTCIKQIF